MGSNWDVIVVGAGSAGATLAGRLAGRGRRVLLIEGGRDYRSAEMDEIWRSPNAFRGLLDPAASKEMLWPDLYAARTAAQAPTPYWRGRGVGGSSAVNGQVAIRPPRDDFDDWGAAGLPRWSWDSVLPYFRRVEDDLDFGDEPYHGQDGPISICRTPRDLWGTVDDAFARAATAAGIGWAADANAPDAVGVSPYPVNARDPRAQRRVTTNDAYLEPVRALSNLTVVGDAIVDRVLLKSGRATGVEVICRGERRREHAVEVVLSAGAIHSPSILMRSGIGPASHLDDMGIEVRVDLPVGEGMQDHATTIIGLPLRPDAAARSADERACNCCARFSSDDPEGVPHDLFMFAQNQAVFPDEEGELPVLAEGEAPEAGAIGVHLNRPFSRGAVLLGSADPMAQPIVEENMLSDPRDLRRMREVVHLGAELAGSEAIADICFEGPRRLNAGLWGALDAGDEGLDDFLLATVTSGHCTSTCRMGPVDGSDSVVDEECRVLGVEGLRVADASVFPSCPRGNTHLAAIVVGEVVADRLDGVDPAEIRRDRSRAGAR